MVASFAPQRLVVAALALSLPLASCFLPAPRTIPVQPQSSALSAHYSQRRHFIQTIASVGTAIIIPSAANADKGKSASIKLPNYIDYLIEKNAEGDPIVGKLYSGPDPETQLRRIGEAAARLPEIKGLAEDKKWSQVQGIISGPLGTLLQTLNSVSSIAGTKEAKDAAKAVKNDLLEIGASAGRKDSTPCIKAAAKAEVDLEKFVKIAFK